MNIKKNGIMFVATIEKKERNMRKRRYISWDRDVKNKVIKLKTNEQAEREFKVLINMKEIIPGFGLVSSLKMSRILEKK